MEPMGVLTDFFRATTEELRAAYPTWREPLEEARYVTRMNPYTREPEDSLSWDPTPLLALTAEGRTGPPEPSIDMKGLTELSVWRLIATVDDASEEAQRRFERPALIGPEQGPWIFEVPASFVEKMALLDDAGRARVTDAWAKTEQEDFPAVTVHEWRDTLDTLAAFAQSTISEQRRMYMWICL